MIKRMMMRKMMMKMMMTRNIKRRMKVPIIINTIIFGSKFTFPKLDDEEYDAKNQRKKLKK